MTLILKQPDPLRVKAQLTFPGLKLLPDIWMYATRRRLQHLAFLVVFFLVVPTVFGAEPPTKPGAASTTPAASAAAPVSPASPDATNRIADLGTREPMDDTMKIGVGDRLSFRILEDQILGDPEPARPMMVTDSGDIDVPYIGRVVAKDKTCRELATYIKTRLEEEYYNQATVVLSLDQFNRSRGKIYVSGYVRAAGALDLPSDEKLTLSKAILRVGGFNEFADKRKVQLIRKSDTNTLSNAGTYIDVEAILERGRTDADPLLESGDLIIVSGRLFKF